MPMATIKQTPIAVVGHACRLPGDSHTPEQFWDFLVNGKIADTTPPCPRFNLDGHYDSSLRPYTMRSPGGMFINVNIEDIDAGFFGLSNIDAVSMDPQQRQLLEVVYEGLENAGLSLERIRSTSFGCFVGSYASDFSDMQNRNPEDRVPSCTVGSGRAMLSNRISHFLDITGPSMTIDTACSGSLVSVDLACRYLHSGDADGAIVAGCNLYMSPEHNMDQAAMSSAASPTGRCWTFDARADGYVKAEGINCLILKRLDDALRDGDPVRAVIRGTSTNSDGRTPGIASPSAEAQAKAIRRAYERAGITDLSNTSYLECHGTGTLAGDPIECLAASTVFSPSRADGSVLRIGSVKSNIGHSEPAAGISAMLKAVLTVERGLIPGNPTFERPNPKIDFEAKMLFVSKSTTPWPSNTLRRASINSFGYGGSNAHAIVEHPSVLIPSHKPAFTSSYSTSGIDLLSDSKCDDTRRLLVFSANDDVSLPDSIKAYLRHLVNPAVSIKSADLAYTLSERRTHHFFRAYVVSNGSSFRANQVVYGKQLEPRRLCFVFTGQGAQWPLMGRDLLANFLVAREMAQSLDETLRSMNEGPSWSLLEELSAPRSADHMRQPEFSQPLTTALQLCLLSVLGYWGIKPLVAVGHSSGEIAAAVAAERLSPKDAIKVAYLRGKATQDALPRQVADLGMLAVGIGHEEARHYVESFPKVQIACINSPKSVTLSGLTRDLNSLQEQIKSDGHFARLLMVDMAYHSDYMQDIADVYRRLLLEQCPSLSSKSESQATTDRQSVAFFSTVHGGLYKATLNIKYWVENMVSPVLFDSTVTGLLKSGMADCLIELGPRGALGGPIKQIREALHKGGDSTSKFEYMPSFVGDKDPTLALFDVAGKLFFRGMGVEVNKVCDCKNQASLSTEDPKVIVDLPNYQWNHSVKYWYENQASKDWRFRPYPVHDLLGTKVLDTSWSSPTFRRTLRLKDVPWIKDHSIGNDIIFPAAAYIAMVAEAMFQAGKASGMEELAGVETISQTSWRLRNVRLLRALVLEENVDHHLYLELSPSQGPRDAWFIFKILTLSDDVWTEHANGLVRLGPKTAEAASETDLLPLRFPCPASIWYKSMNAVGFNFGPLFRNLVEIESRSGQRTSRARIRLRNEDSKTPESRYLIHPKIFDTFFQAGIPSLYQGYRTDVCEALVPKFIEEIVIGARTDDASESAMAVTDSEFVRGRPDKVHNYKSNIRIYDEVSRSCLVEVRGLHCAELHAPQTAEETSQKLHFMKEIWKPDISLLRGVVHIDALAANDKIANLLSKCLRLPVFAAFLLSLLKHKVATPSVLDIDLLRHDHEADRDKAVTDRQALENSDIDERHEEMSSCLSAFDRYVCCFRDSESMEAAFVQFGSLSEVKIETFDPVSILKDTSAVKGGFDLVVLRVSSTETTSDFEQALKSVRNLCSPSGLLLLVEQHAASDQSLLRVEPLLQSSGFFERMKYPCLFQDPGPVEPRVTVRLCSPQTCVQETQRHAIDLTVLDLSNGASEDLSAVVQSLKSYGWTPCVRKLSDPLPALSQQPTLLVDDPASPLLANITESDWVSLQRLLIGERIILWLTMGSQLDTPLPSNALIHGFARSVRGEEPRLNLKTLDLSSDGVRSPADLIARVLENTSSIEDKKPNLAQSDNEFCERHGILYISRVIPDEGLLDVARDDAYGAKLKDMWLRENPNTTRLWCERPGDLNTLHFNEVIDHQEYLGDGEVEVEIGAAGLNFKDIMTSLGVVSEDECQLGLEGAGIITRAGSKVTSYHAGDRVLIHSKGSFSNRRRVPAESVFLLPNTISFEDAATMSIVYFTAIYSFIEIARLQRGQSVLIHSATGGVGLACIQLCRYLGAEIYVTAGSPEKRRFLAEQIGISPERIFSSRDIRFAAEIRRQTNGRGVDYVLNSLTGDLLDASWRLLADHGMLLEIGKKDIVDRNVLSMEPFDRNCAYHGIDISQTSIISDLPLVYRVLQKIRELLEDGHIKPISPRKDFPFTDIKEAMRYMRSGEHVGKIVISSGNDGDVLVPVRPAARRLRLDPGSSYLIVGGLSGLCGSLAIFMARCGARSLIIFSRRGLARDDISQRVLQDLLNLGVKVELVKGDVACAADVKRVFEQSEPTIRGVVQGAMVLRDKTFETMTRQEYFEALSCKFQGTWNLHNAAAETAGQRLDFFTMLSSISGVIGSGGQANYAAGNSFQDAFARYRQSLGLSAQSINLGIVEDVGYMSENQKIAERAQSRSGLSSITERQLHEVLKYSVLQQTTGLGEADASQMITGLPFPLADNSPLLRDARFCSLSVPKHSSKHKSAAKLRDEDGGMSDFLAMVNASAPSEVLVKGAVKLVNKQLVKALGLATDVEESKPLGSYGIDSLAAVDLRNWVKLHFGADLTTFDVLNASSLGTLCAKIVWCLGNKSRVTVSGKKPAETS